MNVAQNADIGAAVNALRQDIDDTNSKLLNAKVWFDHFATIIIEAQQVHGSTMTENEFTNDYLPSLQDAEYPYTEQDYTQGKDVIGVPVFNVKRKEVTTTSETSIEYSNWLVVSCLNTVKIFKVNITRQANGTIVSNGMVDNTVINISDFNPESIMIGNYSVLSLTSGIKESLQTNDFISELSACVKNPTATHLLFSRWLNSGSCSSSLKQSVKQAALAFDGSSKSLLIFLRDLYDSMSKTSVDDDQLQFASTDYFVKNCFTTVGNLIATTLTSLVAIISFAISKVVGVIVSAISAVISSIYNAINSVEHPVIKIKDGITGYYDHLPVPLCQRTHFGDAWAFTGVDRKAICISTPVCSFRIFKNFGAQESTHYESFLRCGLHPDLTYYLFRHTADCGLDVSDFDTWKVFDGPEGFAKLFNDFKFYDSDLNGGDTNPFNFASLPNERTQASWVMLNLLFYWFSFCRKSQNLPSGESSVSWWLNRLKNNTGTVIDNLSGLMYQWFLNIKFGLIKNPPSSDPGTDWDIYWFTTNYPTSTGYGAVWSWTDVINVVMPAIRECSYFDFSHLGTDASACGLKYIRLSGDFITAQDTLDDVAEHSEGVCIWCDECFNPTESPFILPKYSGAGLMATVVTAIVATAAIVAVAVIAINKYKKWGERQQIKRTSTLSKAKADLDAMQQDPSISAEDKEKAVRKFQKQVRRYNLTSFIYGGGSYNSVNGWVDYESASISDVGLADAMSSASNYDFPLIDEAIASNSGSMISESKTLLDEGTSTLDTIKSLISSI